MTEEVFVVVGCMPVEDEMAGFGGELKLIESPMGPWNPDDKPLEG